MKPDFRSTSVEMISFTTNMIVACKLLKNNGLFSGTDHAACIWGVLSMDLLDDERRVTPIGRSQDMPGLLDQFHLHDTPANTPQKFAVGTDRHFIADPTRAAAAAFGYNKEQSPTVMFQPAADELPKLKIFAHYMDFTVKRVNS